MSSIQGNHRVLVSEDKDFHIDVFFLTQVLEECTVSVDCEFRIKHDRLRKSSFSGGKRTWVLVSFHLLFAQQPLN